MLTQTQILYSSATIRQLEIECSKLLLPIHWQQMHALLFANAHHSHDIGQQTQIWINTTRTKITAYDQRIYLSALLNDTDLSILRY